MHRLLIDLGQNSYGNKFSKLLRAEKGGPGSGSFNHAGILGHQGGSAPGKVSLSQHAVQRMKERKKFKSVRAALKKLDGAILPEREWYCEIYMGDKLDGYLVGAGGTVKTVLGTWYNPANLKGMAISVKAMGVKLDLQSSVQAALDNLTQEMLDAFFTDSKVTLQEFKDSWDVYTLSGLATLLLIQENEDYH